MPAKVGLRVQGIVLDEPMLRNSPLLSYAVTVVNLLEGRDLDVPQLVRLLLEVLRQRSIVLRTRANYVLEYLHQHPP